VGTYVTNTGLMATYGGQFTLTMYLASEALCRVLACPVLVRTRHRWSAGSYCTRADTAWCYVRAALFTWTRGVRPRFLALLGMDHGATKGRLPGSMCPAGSQSGEGSLRSWAIL